MIFSCTVGFANLTVAFIFFLFVEKKGRCGLICLIDGSLLFNGSGCGLDIALSVFIRLVADLIFDLIHLRTSILLIRCTCAAKANTSE